MYKVYVISSLTRKYIYVGLTNNLERRLKQHADGKNRSTVAYKPFELIWQESFDDRVSARTREKYLKSGSGKEWIKDNLMC